MPSFLTFFHLLKTQPTFKSHLPPPVNHVSEIFNDIQSHFLDGLVLGLAGVAFVDDRSGGRGAGDDAGFKPIFNGKSLDGWQADPKYWSVRRGQFVGERTQGNSSESAPTCVWRQGSLDDFALRFSCRVTGGDEADSFHSPVLFKPDPAKHGVVDPRWANPERHRPKDRFGAASS